MKRCTDIELPHPHVSTSLQFTEEVENLVDAFDELIISMMERLSLSTGQSLEEIQAELDQMDDIADEDTDSEENVFEEAQLEDDDIPLEDEDTFLGEGPGELEIEVDLGHSGDQDICLTFSAATRPELEGNSNEGMGSEHHRILVRLPPSIQ
jgi:hypothetical protein